MLQLFYRENKLRADRKRLKECVFQDCLGNGADRLADPPSSSPCSRNRLFIKGLELQHLYFGWTKRQWVMLSRFLLP